MNEAAQAVRYLIERVKPNAVERFKPTRPADPNTIVVGQFVAAMDGDTILVVAHGAAGQELLALVRAWGGEPQDASIKRESTFPAQERD